MSSSYTLNLFKSLSRASVCRTTNASMKGPSAFSELLQSHVRLIFRLVSRKLKEHIPTSATTHGRRLFLVNRDVLTLSVRWLHCLRSEKSFAACSRSSWVATARNARKRRAATHSQLLFSIPIGLVFLLVLVVYTFFGTKRESSTRSFHTTASITSLPDLCSRCGFVASSLCIFCGLYASCNETSARFSRSVGVICSRVCA